MSTETQHVMRTMNQSGDHKAVWNPDDAASVAAARTIYNEHTQNSRYTAFRMAPGGARGEQMSEFDPAAAEILLVPPMRGGCR